MTILWILVANTGGAQVYQVQGYKKEKIERLQHFDNPDGRKRSGEVYSDKPGRAFDSMGGNRHALSTEVDLHLHEQQVFAHKLAAFLEKSKEAKLFEELAIVAPPQFLGVLRNLFSANVRRSISKELNKELPLTYSGDRQLDWLAEQFDLI